MKKKYLNEIKLSINDINEINKIRHHIQVWEDIKKNGIRNPVILNNDILIRGTLRFAIAKELGLENLDALVIGEDEEIEVQKYLNLYTHPVGDYE